MPKQSTSQLFWTMSSLHIESFSSLHLLIIANRNYTIHNKALTAVQSFPITSPQKLKRGHSFSPSPSTDDPSVFDISTLTGITASKQLSPKPDQTILIYTKMEVLAHLGNVPSGFINRTTWTPQSSPLINLDRSEWDKHQLVPRIPISPDPVNETWVDIIVNNLDEKGHPFHLVCPLPRFSPSFYTLKGLIIQSPARV